MSVEVKELSKIYGSQHAVDNISFSIKEGEIVGFLGPNGAGKSTTMKVATTYIPPTSGTIEVCGYDVIDKPMEVRKNIGYLPEHNPLYLDMYVHEYIRFIGSLHGIKGRNLVDRVKYMVELCGLTVEQNKKIGALSKGYRQRVGLAQALVHDPKVLILDEPTTGLDPNQIVEIRSLIKSIAKDKTIIFSTHIMQEVQEICDRVIIINKGKIIADKPLNEMQSVTENQSVNIIEFDGPINMELIKAVSGVIEVTSMGGNLYKVTSGKIDVRAEIFKLASDNNWTLLGMKKEEHSLETIFQTLTKKEE